MWPRVLGLRPIQVLVVRDPKKELDDVYLLTTDLGASAGWVIEQFAWRWSIEIFHPNYPASATLYLGCCAA